MKILMVDDDRDVVETVSLGLQMRWPEVELCSTALGQTGIEMAKTEAPDVVILDVGLPDMSGFEVLTQVRVFSKVPVILLTVWSEDGQIAQGLDLGADDYIVKPFRQVELMARIGALMRRQSGK